MAGELILVMDDDPDIVEMLRCLLHGAGYEVVTADAGAALSLPRERQLAEHLSTAPRMCQVA